MPWSPLGARPLQVNSLLVWRTISRPSNTFIFLKSSNSPKPHESSLGRLGVTWASPVPCRKQETGEDFTGVCHFGVICVDWASGEGPVAVRGWMTPPV